MWMYLGICGEFQVNGISCSLIWPASVSQIFFRRLIFNCYNISICKKDKIKDETSKKIRETNGGYTFTQRSQASINNLHDHVD